MKNRIFFLALVLTFQGQVQAQAQTKSQNLLSTSSRLEVLSIPEEWNTDEDSTIVFVWRSSDSPSRFYFRTKECPWTSLKQHRTQSGWYAISISTKIMSDDTDVLYFRICSEKAKGLEESIEGTVRVVIPEKYPPYF